MEVLRKNPGGEGSQQDWAPRDRSAQGENTDSSAWERNSVPPPLCPPWPGNSFYSSPTPSPLNVLKYCTLLSHCAYHRILHSSVYLPDDLAPCWSRNSMKMGPCLLVAHPWLPSAQHIASLITQFSMNK